MHKYLVKFNPKMQRKHICESWRTNRGKLPTDHLISTRVFLPKASFARNWVIRNLRRIQFDMQEKQLYAECGDTHVNFARVNKIGEETFESLALITTNWDEYFNLRPFKFESYFGRSNHWATGTLIASRVANYKYKYTRLFWPPRNSAIHQSVQTQDCKCLLKKKRNSDARNLRKIFRAPGENGTPDPPSSSSSVLTTEQARNLIQVLPTQLCL